MKDYDRVECFFPKKNHMDSRSEFFMGLKKNIAFIPDGETIDALDALVLATHRFEKYLSKPENTQHTLVVPQKELKEVKARLPLLESILWARDLINTPPQDSNPEKITKLVIDRQWRNFDVEVVEEKQLKKLGCNLILAVGAGSDIPPRMIILKPKKPVS